MEENEKITMIPRITFESEMARMERNFKRLWVIILMLIIMLVGSNIAWIVYDSQFEDIEISQDVDTGEGDAFVAGYGDVYYGESETDG